LNITNYNTVYKYVQEVNPVIYGTYVIWSKKFSQKTITIALFEISCGLKGGKNGTNAERRIKNETAKWLQN
jgi:hypothetical protein